jgi:hypothetical protein
MLSETELSQLRLQALQLVLERDNDATKMEDLIKEADKIVAYILKAQPKEPKP